MPFQLRVTEIPPLSQIVQIEQIVIVDKTGAAVELGDGPGATCIVGEFLQGPFDPTEVFSDGELKAIFVGDPNRMDRMSQSLLGAGYVQNGTGVAFDGNGWAELKGKRFNRLVIQRVDVDAVTLAAGSIKSAVKFDLDIDATDQTGGVTNKEIVVPAGTRFATDAAPGTATVIVALSQSITIPVGTTVTANKVTVDHTFLNDNGTPGATCFFVKGLTAAIGVIDAVITGDEVLPNVAAGTKIATAGISTISTSGGAAAAVFPPGTGVTLGDYITAAYNAAIDKTLPVNDPTTEIAEIFSARNWAADAASSITNNIRKKLWQNAIDSSLMGRGRVAMISGEPAAGSTVAAATAAKTAVKALAAGGSPEITTANADRAFISFPYVGIFASELQRTIFVSPGGFRAMMANLLPEEFQTSVPNDDMAAITQMEPAFVTSPMSRADYISLKAAGVGTVILDRTTGWQFQSGVTAANPTSFPTRVADNRRRFADFVQDTVVGLAAKYNKFPGTTERVDALVGEIDGFLLSLLSPESPPQQRIEGYSVDPNSANTPELTALGIRTFILKVRMLGDLNDLVFITEIGPTVVINQVS